jgi:dihydrofolate synthase/folylpolyglutamate synthase
VDVYEDLEQYIEKFSLTFFEAITLIAFELFKREKVEWGVFETGMGGRLDATNILTPKVTVITTIAMDHGQYLGNDLISIAKEKLGIVKKNVPLIISKPQQPEIEALVMEHCASLHAPSTLISSKNAVACITNGNGSCFMRSGRKFVTALRGEFQIKNALVALAATEAAGLSDPVAQVEGVARTSIPGRFHIVELNNKIVVFDVGHNPNAAEVFVHTVRGHFDGLPICVVAGIMSDKDIGGILQSYCSIASRLICTQPKTDRAASAEFLATSIPVLYKGVCDCVPEVDKAVSEALSGHEKVVCITGSFFTVGEAMIALGIEPYGKM